MDNFEHALQKQNEAFRTQLVRAHAYCDEQEVPNGDDLRSRLEGWLAEERKIRQRLSAEVERLTRERDEARTWATTWSHRAEEEKARADAIPALQWEAEHLRAEALALEVRAEAAEADNAALLQSLKSILFVDCCGPVDGLGPRAHVAAAKVAEDDFHPGAALLERLRTVEARLKRRDEQLVDTDHCHEMLSQAGVGDVDECGGFIGLQEHIRRAVERLRAAERVVEWARENRWGNDGMENAEVARDLAAYDAAKEGV